jgi:hypothetical protein
VGTVGLAVDDGRAGAANALAAVVVERDRLLAGVRQVLVDHIEHLQEGHVRVEVRGLVTLELAGGGGVLLAPDLELNFHGRKRLVVLSVSVGGAAHL